MRLPNLSGEFRLSRDPELRFTPGGKAVCSLSIIVSESKKTEAGGWEDGDRSPFINVSVWERAAEAAAEQLAKGDKVLVTGQLFAREYETRDGGKGQSIELKWATVAKVVEPPKADRENTRNGNAPAQSADPWATPAQPAANDPWATPAGNATDEPPF